MAFAYVMGGVTRGLLVALMLTITMFIFVDIPFSHIWAIAFFGIATTMILSLLGVIAGIWAQKFEQSTAINNFIIVPCRSCPGPFIPSTGCPASGTTSAWSIPSSI